MTNFNKIRDSAWHFARRTHPEGIVLSKWLIIVRSILFPIDTFYWRVGNARGYQPEYDSWHINGVKYSSKALKMISESRGETYKIDCTDGIVTLIKLKDEH